MHRDPANFSPSPESFLPERWLPGWGSGLPGSGDALGTEAAGYVHNEAAFIPFSYGPMNCVGKGLAMQEMRTAICAILQRFEVRAREGWVLGDYEGRFRDYFVTVRGHLPVVLEVRGGRRG